MEEKKINEGERAQMLKKKVYKERGRERERQRETERQRSGENQIGGQADGWEPHPGLLPLCLLCPLISS